MYLYRLNIFAEDNPYYKEGGEFNTFTGDIRMPNCTSYCFLRCSESAELKKRDDTLIRPQGGFPNAKDWYKQTSLPKGKVIRDGSIAVFDGTYGHVAFVEKDLGDGRAIITQSQYDSNKNLRNYKYWERREVTLKVGEATLNGVGKLIGYIYAPTKDKRVVRDENREQVQIVEDYVNVRRTANGEILNVGCYAPTGVYNVLDSQEVDGLLWFKLDSYAWVREGEWLIHFLPGTGEAEELKREIASLKEKLMKIKEILDE